jgi:hypothetical protein
MKNMPIYEALAQAFAAEGVDAQFILMGGGRAVATMFQTLTYCRGRA